jgi:hypothetical protein
VPTWAEVEQAAPDLAEAVKERFEATGLAFIATLRADGSPRISGIEPLFAGGELWLGMMPNSRKAQDVLRDPRFALHAATVDKQMTNGDAKISGRAVLADDDETLRRFLEAFEAHNGYAPPPGPFPLFRADVAEVSTVNVAGDRLVVEWWREGGERRRVERT